MMIFADASAPIAIIAGEPEADALAGRLGPSRQVSRRTRGLSGNGQKIRVWRPAAAEHELIAR
jgi:hypothetical protein